MDYAIERHTPSDPEVEVVNRVDVDAIAKRLRRRFARRPPTGYLGGKRRMQDALRRSLRIGPSRAAHLVDRLEEEGAIVYRKSRRRGRRAWHFA